MTARRHFELTDDEARQIEDWDREHMKTCPLREADATIGDRREYRFAPTSIGTFVSFHCACGAMLDVESNL